MRDSGHGLIVVYASRDFPQPMLQKSSVKVDDYQPGQLLKELEQRQDEVLEQLDALDLQLQDVLKGLGVTLTNEVDADFV